MCSATRLLIIDDDKELCDLLQQFLSSAGFDVEAVHDGAVGARRALSGEHAAAVLDVMLPGSDGFSVLRQIRERSRLPVIMLTARGEEADRISGLETGADDYLPKPFNPRELVARLRAVLRRAQPTPDGVSPPREPSVIVADLRLDPGTRTVQLAGQEVDLTSTEFDLLEALARAAGRTVTREELSRTVFGRPLFPEDRSIDVHISHLRRKLGPRNGGGERIKTLRGAGYLYVMPDESPVPAAPRA